MADKEEASKEEAPFKVIQKIGEGTYGIVYKIIDKDGREYAYKRVMSQLTKQPGAYTESVREADILSRLNKNPRIVHLMMVSLGCPPTDKPLSPLKSEDRVKLVDDLLHFLFENAHSNLRSWLKKTELSFNQLKQLMVDILLGAESISLAGILHRDLNPSNILIFEPGYDPLTPEGIKNLHTPSPDVKILPKTPSDSKGLFRAKICDFGLAIPNVEDGKRTPGTVTPWYRAPEIIGENGDYGTKSDAWSVGCIFFEMLFKTPFTGKVSDTKNDLVTGILRNSLYKLSDHEIKDVMSCERRRQTSAPRPLKPRIVSSKPLRIMVECRNGKPARQVALNVNMDTESLKVVEELCQVIGSLLTVDPEKRASVSDVLEMPFFNSHAEYIQAFRDAYPPRYPYEYEYDIKESKARSEAAEYMVSIFNQQTNYDWYGHRSFFHAIDLFDRVLRYYHRIGKNITDDVEAELHFFSCLYISIRYFSTLSAPIEAVDILPNHLQRKKENLQRLAEIELVVLLDVIEYNFYRHSIYEAISELETDVGKEPLFREAAIVLAQCPKRAKGHTPSTLANKLLETYDNE